MIFKLRALQPELPRQRDFNSPIFTRIKSRLTRLATCGYNRPALDSRLPPWRTDLSERTARYLDLVSGRSRGWPAALQRAALRAASWPYCGFVALRNASFDH